ncbi:hypothetical protein [Kineosporia succinea]|uniref:Uncharacterized protein n=1 Tax=Kineosporia succinea TaxID=84632 RepID=A0ABT9NZF9_9ACTN|nr:hypothetical protein [Kineosporia succinea]MDP9825200.1 hypothetical protein [Kineosporia succinea]
MTDTKPRRTRRDRTDRATFRQGVTTARELEQLGLAPLLAVVRSGRWTARICQPTVLDDIVIAVSHDSTNSSAFTLAISRTDAIDLGEALIDLRNHEPPAP